MISKIESNISCTVVGRSEIRKNHIRLYIEDGYRFNGMPLAFIKITYTNSFAHNINFFGKYSIIEKTSVSGDYSILEVIAFAFKKMRTEND